MLIKLALLSLIGIGSFALNVSHAQINTTEGDWVFNISGAEVLRFKTNGVLDVSGSLKLPESTIACSLSTKGSFRYDSGAGKVNVCDGTTWQTLELEVAATPGGYFVLSDTTWDGNLGGFAGATSKCITELGTENWLGKGTLTVTSTVEAFVLNPALDPNTEYKFAVAGQPTIGGASFTTDGFGVGPNDSADWSGATYFGGTYAYWSDLHHSSATAWQFDDTDVVSDCSGFTDNGFAAGNTGASNKAGFKRWNDTDVATLCPATNRLICVVNP
jgi:hypothetical protein